MSAEEFANLSEEQAEKILVLLREPTVMHRLRFWERRPRDPELRKLLRRICTAIRDAQRLAVDHSAEFDAAATERATKLLSIDVRTLDLDTAFEAIDGWDQLLIEHGDERYIRDLLVVEFARDRIDTTAWTWRDVYGERPPKAESEPVSSGSTLDDELLKKFRNQLAGLYRARSTLYDLDRARLAMKGHHLLLLAPVLLVLIVGFAVAIGIAGGGWDLIALVALAGAIGALLSGTFQLRDQIRTISALRAFWPALLIQPLFGATAGLFLLVVLESGAITLDWGGSEWARYGAAAFVAGFSEPFLLGVVKRVAEIGESTAPEKVGEAQRTTADRRNP